ncbi:hypothetical protein [Limosilactobacillus reuteri]|uniref:hypothetical protein n=1 Tax=Limosilactobacillus reuteri TaxID=1598 RepID=UPI003D983267
MIPDVTPNGVFYLPPTGWLTSFYNPPLFTNQLDLGIKDNDIIETLKKSNRRYPMTKTKAAIEELEALGAIEIVSKRPKQHVITIL